MLQIGDMQIHLINDCNVMVDAGGVFGLVPRALWQGIVPPDDDNRVPMQHTCLLVQANGQNIVVDTGFGDKLTDRQKANQHWQRPNGGLVDGLARLGLSPSDIHLVIDTHLHGDHAGGNTLLDANGAVIPVFPNAEYVTQRREYQDAMRPNERTRATYILDNYHPLVESGQMRLLDGDTDLAPGIRGVVTPGHTPGHMSVFFERDGQHIAFLCDLASLAVHFERLAWMTAYDVEPLVTLESKRIWQKWALETDALLIFPHDTTRPVGRLKQDDSGRLHIQPIDEAFV